MYDDMRVNQVRVDADLCEGHALCVQLAPEVFDLSADEVADVTRADREWDRATWDTVKSAVDACPRQAISLTAPSTKGH